MIKYELENLLTLEKSLITLYLNGTVESSNEKVRNLFEDGLTEVLVLQDELYQMMKDDGFYAPESLKESDIKKIYNKLNESGN